MSFYLTRDLAAQAFALVLPSITELFRAYGERGCLHVVVMDPTAAERGISGKQAILFEESVNRDTWGKHRFDEIARAKAFISERTGLSSFEMHQCPYLYKPGDVKYGGSVVFNEIVVAASGVQPHFDQLCSYWLAAACQALAIERFQPLLSSDQSSVPLAL
jgi:hypothetical protein